MIHWVRLYKLLQNGGKKKKKNRLTGFTSCTLKTDHSSSPQSHIMLVWPNALVQLAVMFGILGLLSHPLWTTMKLRMTLAATMKLCSLVVVISKCLRLLRVCVFRVEGLKFLKLNRGTWHAGPLFKADTMDFYNLELSNTNVSSLSKLVLKFMYAFWCICKATLELWSDLSSASNLFWIKHCQGRPCAYKHDKYACVLFYVIIFLGVYFNVSLFIGGWSYHTQLQKGKWSGLLD